MQHSITHSEAHSFGVHSKSLTATFIGWCEKQQENRLFWLAITVLIQTCVLIPVIWFLLSLSEKSMIFWLMPSLAIVMTLVTNLSALPTKITIPVFILSILIDFVVIASCLV